MKRRNKRTTLEFHFYFSKIRKTIHGTVKKEKVLYIEIEIDIYLNKKRTK